jgi:acyl dehydratase
MRRQAVGVESPPVTMEVEKGAIIKFAEAIGDPNPLWTDEAAARQTRYGGLIAPPIFLRSMRGARPELPFELPFTRALDGGSDWEYFQPIRPGDRITAVARITDIRERPGRLGLMIFITTEITYRNQFDEVVATQTNTSIRY